MVNVTDLKTGASSKDSLEVERWLEALASDRSEHELALIRQACDFAQRAHDGQERASGEPFFQHALAVANILVSLRLDHETIAAALLHDVVEDTTIPLEKVNEIFGPGVARLVDGVTKMDVTHGIQSATEHGKKERRQTEALRKMLLAMADDVRVVLIKLADRLHNMRTLVALDADKQRRIADETLSIYAPLANRLGIWHVKWELEDLAFRHMEPAMYKNIAHLVAERRVDRESYITHFMELLSTELAKAGIQAEVMGRPKHIYSIWRKMQRKGLDYQHIYDVRAVRVLVNKVHDCYAALGIVHNLWQYIPGEFDDYIATPKENNYRSIHTAVIGPQGKTVEVQIRTHKMHQHNELGVAAHWRYKEGSGHDPSYDRKITLLRQLLEWKEDITESADSGQDIHADLFEDRVYVFSPQGDIIDLPQDATPLDFAYHIHTELGHRCRGAKVNGNMVPLTYRLQTGQQVEILTIKRGVPSRDWLNPHLGYLKTHRARSKVQNWFKQQNVDANIAAGRASFEKELHRVGASGINFEELAKRLHFAKADELFAALGRGDLKNGQVIHAVQEMLAPAPRPSDEALPLAKPSDTRRAAGGVKVVGVGNLMTNLARCCKPVAGDNIVGYITRGRGVTIHRRDCSNVLRYNSESPQRLIEVEWGDGAQTYPVDIHILSYDRQGLLRDITAVLANENINVIAVETLSDKQRHNVNMTLTLEVVDMAELGRILTKISQLPNIIEAKRYAK